MDRWIAVASPLWLALPSMLLLANHAAFSYHELPRSLPPAAASRVEPDAGSLILWCLANSPCPPPGSVPETPTLSRTHFIVSLSNVLAIKLIYDTDSGTVETLSKAVPCLLMCFLGSTRLIEFPSGTWDTQMKSHRPLAVSVCQSTTSVIAPSSEVLLVLPLQSVLYPSWFAAPAARGVLEPNGADLQRFNCYMFRRQQADGSTLDSLKLAIFTP